MMHRQVPGIVVSTAVRHQEQAVLYGYPLLHSMGPEAPLQAGALPASIAWMMAVVNA